MIYADQLKKYDALVAKCPKIERKGKTMPYTSSNGYMFSLLNKSGEIGIRFSKEKQKEYIEKFNSDYFFSYGANMNGYVLIPNEMLEDIDTVAQYLQESFEYVNTLPPK